MSLEFDYCTLADVSVNNKGEYGIGASAVDYSDELYTYLRITDINDDGTINKNELKSVDDEESYKYLLKENDIVFARTGNSTGKAYYYDPDDGELVFAGFLIKFSLDDKKINPKYMKYYVLSEEYKSWVNSMCTGSTRPNINAKMYGDMDLKLPPREQQDFLVDILEKLDKKISINKKINHNLDELCHIIFKHYFIDFDPFIDKGFVDSEIGEIPKEWTITTVGNILDCKLGGTPSRSNESYWGGDIAWINSGKINEFRIIEPSEYITEEGLKKSATKLLPAKTTVIAITGATLGQISLLEIDSCANQSVIGVIPNKEYPYEFVYPLISSILDDLLKHQTGGAQQHINKNNVESFNIVCPPKDIISKYTNIVSPLYSQISSNCFEIEKLQKLRDTLLPKLMSGEIDVSKINCDLKLYFSNSILKLTIRIRRYFNMKTKIISKIQNQMKPFLNQGQYLKLTNSLLNSFKDVEILDNNNESNEIDNFKLLNSFLSAKQVEGRSEKTIVYYKSTLEKMLTKVNKQVYNITTDDIRKYLYEHKQEKNSSKITIDNMRRIFSSFFSWLEDEDYILKNPVRRIHRVKTGRVVKEVLTDENLEVLRDNCEEIRDLAIVEILISTGIRVGELVRLNIEDINFYERECVVFGKGESERVVYFDARTKIHLIEYLESRTDENPALFVSLNNPHERLGISGVETRLRELGKKCNIPKVHPHKFRRTLATNAIDKGMPIEQVQKLLGHVQIDTTMQYAMVNQSNVKIAHRKFIS